MPRTVKFSSDSKKEILVALAYYFEESSDAATKFRATLKYAVTQISEFPHRYPILIDDLRRVVLLRFPFIVVYQICDDHIYVVAVAHAKRFPFYWKRDKR